jgi:hypothetical protein
MEIQAMLGMVLSASEHTKMIPVASDGTKTPTQSLTVNVSVQSAGYHDGNFSRVTVTGNTVNELDDRGLNVALLSPYNGSLIETASFDTHISNEESDDFARLLDSLEPGVIVIVSSKDDCSEQMTEAAKLACESIGSSKIRELKYRDSWCIIGRKGAVSGSVAECLKRAKSGTSDILHTAFEFGGITTPAVPVDMVSDVQMLPSKGYWIRRRKIDGALQRTPPGFYPKIHKLLERSVGGIRVGTVILPRDPTVSEKTPEEINFALQVESMLNAIHDPAQRQLAVECLTMIAEIERRNPEIEIGGGHEVLDLTRILTEACQLFWQRWLQRDGFRFGFGGSLEKPPTLDSAPFQQNEALARRLFYDLPQDGKDGTMNYLAKASFKTLPYEVNFHFEPTPVMKRQTDQKGVADSNDAVGDCRPM